MSSSREPVAWVLNLDAEDELAHSGAHTPNAQMKARIDGLLPGLSSLVLPGDRVVWPGGAEVAPGIPGRAWCPTRWALSQLAHARLGLPPAPGMDVLRRVNHRRFNHELGQFLPGAGFARDADALSKLLSRGARASREQCWLAKRPFGYAGRGRRKWRAGELIEADDSWLEASLRDGEGLQVEPWVERLFDCALHGFLLESGECTFGQVTLQEVETTGAWRSTVLAPAGTLSSIEEESLLHEAQRTAEALHAAGYFGPFGLDGYRWLAPDDTMHFQPRSEINARYSMGWAIGMSART